MYTDYMLRFENEAEAEAALYTQEPVAWDTTDEENPIPTEFEPRARFRNIDTIGVIYEGGEWDSEGEVITEPVAKAGWHVNVRVVDDEDASGLEAYAVQPESPVRVWV